MPAPGDGLPAGQFVTQFNIPFILGVAGTTTIPVEVVNDSEAPLCVKAIPVSQVPAADIAVYSGQLPGLVSSGLLTEAEALAIATALGLQLD
jgi:hypothetical protein